MAEFLSQLNSALESGLGRMRSFVKFIISEQPKAVLACGCSGGGVDRGDISCPGTINWMAGVIVAVSNMVNWSGVTSVNSSASPSAALEYTLFTALQALGHHCYLCQVLVGDRLHHGVDTGKPCQVPDWDESIMVGFDIFLVRFSMDVISQ